MLKVLVVCVVVLAPVTFALLVAIQVKEEAKLAVKGMLNVPPLQTVAVFALLMVIGGLTVTVTVWAVPAQEPLVEVGVTV